MRKRKAPKKQYNLSKRLSVIFIAKDENVTAETNHRSNNLGCPVFVANLNNQSQAWCQDFQPIDVVEHGDGFSSLVSDSVSTP